MPCLASGSTDANSKNGMMTKVWGPAGWLFLHSVSFGYPENPDQYDVENGLAPGTTRSHYLRFFKEIGYVLPCRYCRDSYREFINIDRLEDNLQNRDRLIDWFWRIHNKVNEKLGSEYCDASLKEIKQRYESYRAKCKALSKSEIKLNAEKGCITPADGTPKKCQIDIVKTIKGDIGRRNHTEYSGWDFILDKKRSLLILLILLIILIGIIFNQYINIE